MDTATTTVETVNTLDAEAFAPAQSREAAEAWWLSVIGDEWTAVAALNARLPALTDEDYDALIAALTGLITARRVQMSKHAANGGEVAKCLRRAPVSIPGAAKVIAEAMISGDRAGLERMLKALDKRLGHPIQRVYRNGREEEWDHEAYAEGRHTLQQVPRQDWARLRKIARDSLIDAYKGRSPLAVDLLARKIWQNEQEAGEVTE